jgi:MerR family transcriptional regulator, light-induced transcriptional regulator
MDRDTPTYNLKAVVQETGIKPDTLRAWERRYGLPDPNRSSGGHRLYSQRDIDTLLWLMARQNEGLTISRAVELWRSVEGEGRDPLRIPEYASVDTNLPPVQGEEIEILRKRWAEACLAFDERTAERILAQSFAIYPVEVVCLDILQKGMSDIGKGWYEGKVSVQQEHFSSALAMRRIDAMLGASPQPTRTGRILIACAPGEEHVFSQMLLQLLLRRRGWETIYLGANVPLDRLESSLDHVRPHLVILTAQRLSTAATLLEMAETLQDKGIAVAFGGRVFTEIPTLRNRIPGHFLGESIRDALERVEDLVPVSGPIPEPQAMDPDYQQALTHFQDRVLDIHARVADRMHSDHTQQTHIATTNLDLAQNIIAALKLGDISLVNEDVEWISGLLANHKLDQEMLGRYFEIYNESAQKTLSQQGQPVLAWLQQTTHNLAGNGNGNQGKSSEQMKNGQGR